MSVAEQIIAKALRQHGAPTEAFPDDEFDCCAEEVVSALHKAGMEIVQLPEPDDVDDDGNTYFGPLSASEGMVLDAEGFEVDPKRARRWGEQWLAAARVAESNE